MKTTLRQIFLLVILLFFSEKIFAQCPTIGIPANVAKGKFEINYRGTPTLVDGSNANLKITVCGATSFTFTDKTTLTGTGLRRVYYFGQVTNNTVPPATFFTARSPLTVGNAAGTYILIQAIVDNTNAIKAYLCQPIEVLVPTQPVFTLSTCKAQETTINIPTHTRNAFDSYTINWGDGRPAETIQQSQIPFTKNYTYTNTTTKIVTVTGIKTGNICNGIATAPIQPTGNSTFTPTIFSLTVADDVSNDIRYIGANYTFDFNEKQSDGTYKKIASAVSSGSGGLTVQKLPAKTATQTQYCYKISITDACGKTRESVDEICSIPLQVTATHKKNELKWTAITNTKFTEYRFTASGALQRIRDAKTTTYNDITNIRCIDYSYNVTAAIGTMTSISNTARARGIDTTKPAPITNVFTTVEKGKASVQINGIPTGQTLRNYTFYRQLTDKLESIYVGNGNRILDDKSDPNNKRECYRIAYENSCNVSSNPSDLFCPVFLQQAVTGLEWTEYLKFSQGLNAYFVEKLDEKGVLIGTGVKVDKNLNYEPDPASFDPNQPTVKFRIRAEATNRQNSLSNEIEYAQKLLMFIPDAFSPNADKINDDFVVKGIAIKEFKMKISDRLGRALFETENYKEAWDGTYGGEIVAAGMYLYEIRAKDFKGEITNKSGRILVIR